VKKRITRTRAFKLLKSADCGDNGWSVRAEKTGVGDYGKSETYSLHGSPIVRVEVDFSSGGTAKAFDVRRCCIGDNCGMPFNPHGKTSAETGVPWAERYCLRCLAKKPRHEIITEQRS
jgi:hypothetical protein